MTVFIFGARGMLGRYVDSVLSKHHTVVPLCREDFDLARLKHLESFLNSLGVQRDDIFINCAALLKNRIKDFGIETTIRINTLFPQALAAYCAGVAARLIHISSDYVFSGFRGQYNESAIHDPLDVYGKTKSLGEPASASVIRTSIIGEEIDQDRYLLEWVRSQTSKLNGFIDHWWNGVTCLQLAEIVREIIAGGLYWRGARHIHSPDQINKYQLVSLINDIYQLDLRIIPTEAGYCNRCLCTLYDLPRVVPDIADQIAQMKNFSLASSH